jgi:hypothetical protein
MCWINRKLSSQKIVIPSNININGKSIRNKWKIPSGLNEEETLALIKIKKLAHKLDASCFCGINIGLDPIFGILPLIGDFAGILLSIWLIFNIKSELLQRNKFKIMIIEMALNIFIDSFVSIISYHFIIIKLINFTFAIKVGIVPIIGDLFDVIYKSNTSNALIFQKILLEQANPSDLNIV